MESECEIEKQNGVKNGLPKIVERPNFCIHAKPLQGQRLRNLFKINGFNIQRQCNWGTLLFQ